MGYRKDEDLQFLKYAKNEDLEVLINYLTKGKNGKERWNQTLTKSDTYKEYQPDHQKYWFLIASELQYYGSNTLSNIVVRRGGLYRNILIDVCKKMGVKPNKKSKTNEIEKELLIKIFMESIENLSQGEIKQVLDELGIKSQSYAKEAILAAIQIAIRNSGFLPYKMAVIIANAVSKTLLSRGLSFAANSALTKSLSIFAGPTGWIATGALLLINAAGPAYRVTIPSVIQVAYMRLLEENKYLIENDGQQSSHKDEFSSDEYDPNKTVNFILK